MLRSESEIGCAHCTNLTADRACGICTRMICATCAADWTTCPEPVGRVLRLGATARIRDIDPDGRLAIVSHWRKPVRAFDLRALQFMPLKGLHGGVFSSGHPITPRLSSRRALVYADLERLARRVHFRGLTALSLDTFELSAIETRTDVIPERGLEISMTGDWIAYIGQAQQIHIAAPGMGPRVFTSRLAAPIQAVSIDSEARYLATAGRGELALDVMNDDRLLVGGSAKTAIKGDVVWLGVAGRVIAAAVQEANRGAHIEVRRIGSDLSIGRVVHSFSQTWNFRGAALSRDGSHLAVAYGSQLHVMATETGTSETLEGHSDQINALRFSDRHALISADTDNRVIIRPRTPTGYDVRLAAAEV